MPGIGDVGKEHEDKVKQWLDRPEDGYSFDRIPDQLTGFWGSKNICDFTCFRAPYLTYIECKATYEDRFDFNMITETQHDGLLIKSKIANTFGVVIVLFATQKRAFVIDINEIKRLEDSGKKSINIKKIDKWDIKYKEIRTIPNNRKKHLDYEGEIEEYLPFSTKPQCSREELQNLGKEDRSSNVRQQSKSARSDNTSQRGDDWPNIPPF